MIEDKIVIDRKLDRGIIQFGNYIEMEKGDDDLGALSEILYNAADTIAEIRAEYTDYDIDKFDLIVHKDFNPNTIGWKLAISHKNRCLMYSDFKSKDKTYCINPVDGDIYCEECTRNINKNNFVKGELISCAKYNTRRQND